MDEYKYFKKIVSDFDKEIKAIQKAKNPDIISVHERSVLPILKEIQLAAPRLSNAVYKVSRQRRKEISRGE